MATPCEYLEERAHSFQQVAIGTVVEKADVSPRGEVVAGETAHHHLGGDNAAQNHWFLPHTSVTALYPAYPTHPTPAATPADLDCL